MERPFFKYEYYLKAINIAMYTSVSGPVTENLLCSALDYLGSIHPIFRSEVDVTNEDNKVMYKWTPMKPGKKWYSFEYVPRSYSRQVVDIFEKSFQKPFPERGPFAKIYLIQSEDKKINEIILAASHILFDGRSFMLFFDQLLFVMASFYQGKDPAIPQQTDLYSPANDTLDIKQEPAIFGDFAALPISTRVPSRERKWAITHRTMPEKDHFLSNLKVACRARGVTVNAALCAAVVTAMDMECKKNGAKNHPTYLVGNAAHVVGGSSSQICSLNVTSIVTEIKQINALNFWEFARTYNDQLKKKISERKFNFPVLAKNSELCPHDIADTDMFDTQGRVLSFSMSNVGDANKLLSKKSGEEAWTHAPFKIEDTFCSAGREALGPCFLLAVMTFNGNVSLSVSFPIPTYERSLLQKILDSTVTIATQNFAIAKM